MHKKKYVGAEAASYRRMSLLFNDVDSMTISVRTPEKEYWSVGIHIVLNAARATTSVPGTIFNVRQKIMEIL